VPQFGTVVCQGSTPPTYEYPEKNFSGSSESVVSFDCISDCSFEQVSWITDSSGRGVDQGGQACSTGWGLSFYIYVGSNPTPTFARYVLGNTNGNLPVNFDRTSGSLTIKATCCPLGLNYGCTKIADGFKAKIKQTTIWLYDGNPGQPVPQQVDGSVNCIPNSFVQKYSNKRVISGDMPSDISSVVKPPNYQDILTIQNNLLNAPVNMRPGQTYSYLYGWNVVPNINILYKKDGSISGYCGGSVGNRQVFDFSTVTTASGSCYLIPTTFSRNAECCYNEDCKWKDPSGSLVCDPNTFSCSEQRPCNSDIDCQVPGEASCLNKQETSWNCNLNQKWYPYQGTCVKTTKVVPCCSDNDCPDSANQYCDKEKGCLQRYVLMDCPSGKCCESGGNYKPQSCYSGLQCCHYGDPIIGECKTSCAPPPTQTSQPSQVAQPQQTSQPTTGENIYPSSGTSMPITGNLLANLNSTNLAVIVGIVIAICIGGFLVYRNRKSGTRIVKEVKKHKEKKTDSKGKFCTKCGSKLNESQKFCTKCGKEVR
jgi:hypothetical protein